MASAIPSLIKAKAELEKAEEGVLKARQAFSKALVDLRKAEQRRDLASDRIGIIIDILADEEKA